MSQIKVPLTVPPGKKAQYLKNYRTATRGTGRMMMFAGDQKVEHLNNDFVGKGIPAEVADPEHYFKIASQAHIGVFATQVGMIAKYGRDYPDIPYLIKINSKTNLMTEKYQDPFSNRWLRMNSVQEFKKQSGLNIVGVGYTVYLGSSFEADMFGQASRIIYKAHKEGMLAVIWMYPRGRAVKDKDENTNIHLLAGAAGVGLTLGTDFVKIQYPYTLANKKRTAEKYREVVTAAGRSGVICVGGGRKDPKKYLQLLHDQINISGTKGNATGRNIYQRALDEAIRMANAISAVSLYNHSAEDAYKIYTGEKKLKVKKK
jgi:fructose-bisphosphate aldolase/6-deoxy-5-ketofructose 1-phosphate synthase